jgi:hypothetical protein
MIIEVKSEKESNDGIKKTFSLKIKNDRPSTGKDVARWAAIILLSAILLIFGLAPAKTAAFILHFVGG